MTLVFPAWRRSYFAVTGSVITEALRRGHTVDFRWHHDVKDPVVPEQVRQCWPAASWTGTGDVYVGPQLETHAHAGDRAISLDAFWDQANAPVRADLTQCYASPYQRDLAGGVGPVTGMTPLDAIHAVDPEALRWRYGLTRPVLLFFAAKFNAGPRWWRWGYKYTAYLRLVLSLRDWCDQRGWRLVVKTRPKHRNPGFLRTLADHYVDTDDLWPHGSAQWLSVAHLVVHFQSAAALEAAAFGVPQYSVPIPHGHLASYRSTRDGYSGAPYTMSHWPAVVHPWPGRPDLFAVDPVERQRYLDRYAGPAGAAPRVLDVVEAA